METLEHFKNIILKEMINLGVKSQKKRLKLFIQTKIIIWVR
jgi:hypothetical protein